MSPRANGRRVSALSPWAVVALLLVGGCSSIADFGRLDPEIVTDDIHTWVGWDAAARGGAPVSSLELTDDEHTLRDLAFALIEPPYDRQRWDAVVYEYGIKTSFRRDLWSDDPTAYYRHLEHTWDRSPAARYNQLMDDVRNDVVRIEPFFTVARRVLDTDRRREASMQYIADLSVVERENALARMAENSLTVAWVQNVLTERCASYRFALEHLVVAEPQPVAADADRVLAQLQQQIAHEGLPPLLPHLAARQHAAAK